jgi:hypothetical protein
MVAKRWKWMMMWIRFGRRSTPSRELSNLLDSCYSIPFPVDFCCHGRFLGWRGHVTRSVFAVTTRCNEVDRHRSLGRQSSVRGWHRDPPRDHVDNQTGECLPRVDLTLANRWTTIPGCRSARCLDQCVDVSGISETTMGNQGSGHRRRAIARIHERWQVVSRNQSVGGEERQRGSNGDRRECAGCCWAPF